MFRDYLKYANSQLTSDEADSVIAVVCCCFPFFILMIGWSLDFSKNVVVRSDLEEIALESVQAGIRAQDGIGNIECTNTGWLTRNGAVNAVKTGQDGSSKVGLSTQLALKTYLIKTARADANDFISTSKSDMKDSIYNEDTYTDGNLDNDVASNADSIQVATYRQLALAKGVNVKTADSDYGYTAFKIKITCSKASDRQNSLSNGETVTTGSDAGNRGVSGSQSDQINIEVKDWCGNFFLGNPITNQHYTEDTTINYDTDLNITTSTRNVQRFEIKKSAIAAWSQSTLNSATGTSHP